MIEERFGLKGKVAALIGDAGHLRKAGEKLRRTPLSFVDGLLNGR